MLATLQRRIEQLAFGLAALGAAIIVVQMLWISYGVFMRYVVGRPDGMVTEATALLLFPAAFLGLAYALKEDAFPKVLFLRNALGARGRRLLDLLNLALMVAVGGFFAIAGVDATLRAFDSGAASEVLLWPRYLFWAPGALSLVVFLLYVVLRLVALLAEPAPADER